jgi:5'-nucleotidase
VRVVGGSNPLVPTIFFAVPLILLTNDDGIDAEGLRCLEESVRGLADTVIVAPDRERSAVSHGLTIHSPLQLAQIDAHHFTLNGTPADCVIHALTQLLNQPPDLVISGINHGANLADDIMYSGTVAAAREASRHGVPSLAVSQAYNSKPVRFREGGRFIRTFVERFLQKNSHPGMCLNINLPVGDIRGAKITRQGCTQHFPHFNAIDRSGEPTEYAGLDRDASRSELPLDFQTIVDCYVSITPLQRDQTDYAVVRSLQKEMPRLSSPRRLPRLGLIR